jgi:signal transduction histidine kinase
VAAYNGIVMNLMTNAMKALIPKVPGEPRRIRLYATNEGAHHTLVCADNGIGIPGYVRTRIWDPLFTTTASTDEDNPLGSGLGLGLSVVKQVVQGLGGRIELLEEAPPGFATAFKVTLPLEAKGS